MAWHPPSKLQTAHRNPPVARQAQSPDSISRGSPRVESAAYFLIVLWRNLLLLLLDHGTGFLHRRWRWARTKPSRFRSRRGRLPQFRAIRRRRSRPRLPAGRVIEAEASGFEQLRAPPELRLWLASFRCMANFVFDPPLRLARDVTVRTLDDAAEFARTFVGPRLPHRRDRLVRRLQEVSDNASARIAARSFRAWAITEGLLAEET
jgi:hypothetical protein